MTACYLIMAGGTGGHIFPALAVAKKLLKNNAKVYWLGTAKSMEERLLATEDVELKTITVKGFRGKHMLDKLLAPLFLLAAVLQSIKIILLLKPDVVIGFGGFVSAPGGIAAKLLGRKLVIHEQNSVAGSTNKLLARWANKILEAFSGSLHRAIHVGNPVREPLLAISKNYLKQDIAARRLKLLVMGGSLGAVAINEVVPMALAELPANYKPEVWHQTGRDKKLQVEESYKNIEINVRIDEFIEDMADAYQWADIVICRAGALTVSELAVVGLPAIFIPLPSAIDNHQFYNAKWLVDNQAAIMLEQKNMTHSVIAEKLLELKKSSNMLLTMHDNLKKIALPEATSRVANYCEELRHAS